MRKTDAMTADLFASEPAPAKDPQVFTVSEVTRAVRRCMEKSVGEVWVQGEVCNHRKQSSGHQYFGLKDERALLTCVLFYKNSLRQPPLADGMLVQVRGDMTVYEARGQYQLVVNLVQAAGAGLLQARFEALKRKLDADGLFAAERKKTLPMFPRAVGLVTSPSGAALRDVLNIMQRRAPWVRIVIDPVRVQGTGAAVEIAAAVRELNEPWVDVDVIVVCRGGGSAEDLWEFNEEIVARAIFESRLPVVSAIGHEIDFTMADFVADLRASTPSAAAEMVVPDAVEVRRRFAQWQIRMQREVSKCLTRWRAWVEGFARAGVFRDTRKALAELSQRIDYAEETLRRGLRVILAARRQRVVERSAAMREHRPDHIMRIKRQELVELANNLARAAHRRTDLLREREQRAAAMLRVLSPEATLSRGYSVTMNAEGRVVRSEKQVRPRMKLITRLRDGSIVSTVNAKS